MADLDEIVSAVATAKKYRGVCTDTIRRIAESEMANQANFKGAVKATKRRLHQVYGAFEEGLDYGVAYESLATARSSQSPAGFQAACRQILAMHSSTHERLPILDSFYPAIWQIVGRPDSILDLGCGLSPLSWPWMGLPLHPRPGQTTRYVALDIDADRIRFVNRFLALVGLAPLARCQDILVRPPADEADVALLLKMSPSLERQEAGATLRLLDRVHAPVVVVSFAVKSLGGREKGMIQHYGQQFRAWVHDRQWHVQELVLGTELLFVVRKA